MVGTGYVPERGRSEEAAPTGGVTDRVAVDTELAMEVVFPPGEEASAAPTSGFGRELRKKRKRSKRKTNGKSEAVCLPCEDVTKAPDWPESTSSRWDRLLASGTSSDSSATTSATTRVQRSSTLAPSTDRPTWGFMRNTLEEKKDDKDWGVWVQEAERKWRDDKMRGSSPPPKVKLGQPGPNPYGVHLDSKGRECAPGWGSPRQESSLRSKELVKPEEGFVPIREESSCRSPDESAKQKTKRPFNRPRGKDATKRTRTPDSSPESEEEECSFMVRFKKGSKEAQVRFLGNEKSEGWEGPFDTSLSMEEVRDFSLKFPPRARGRSTSPTVSLGSDRYTPTSEKESESDSESSKGKEWKQFDGELDKYLTRGRGAGYRTILEAERKTKDLRRKYYRLLSEEWSALNPHYKVGEGVWVCSKEDGVAKWRKACIQKVILPTELQYREGMIDILYQTSQVPIGRMESVIAIGKESDIRPVVSLIIIDRCLDGTYSPPPPAKVTMKLTLLFFFFCPPEPRTSLKRVSSSPPRLLSSSPDDESISSPISFASLAIMEVNTFPPDAFFLPFPFFLEADFEAIKAAFLFPPPSPPLVLPCLKRHASPYLQYPFPRDQLKQIPFSASSGLALR